MATVATRYRYRNHWQIFERVFQIGPDRFELHGHDADPRHGPYLRYFSRWEFMQWATEQPQEVSLFPS